jgi:pre-mRNA-splicing factor SYF1
MAAETAVRVYRRYLKLEPTHAEEYIAYLKTKVRPLAVHWGCGGAKSLGGGFSDSSCVAQSRWGDAAKQLATLLNDDTFRSLDGRSKHQMWLELCDMVTKHPKDVEGMRVDAIIRGGIRK